MWKRLLEIAGIELTGETKWVLRNTVLRMEECGWCHRKSPIFWEQKVLTNKPYITFSGYIICTACAETEAEAIARATRLG